MDLRTMGAKLEGGMYEHPLASRADFNLMISNAKWYYAPGSFVHNAAIALENFYERRMHFVFRLTGI